MLISLTKDLFAIKGDIISFGILIGFKLFHRAVHITQSSKFKRGSSRIIAFSVTDTAVHVYQLLRYRGLTSRDKSLHILPVWISKLLEHEKTRILTFEDCKLTDCVTTPQLFNLDSHFYYSDSCYFFRVFLFFYWSTSFFFFFLVGSAFIILLPTGILFL